MNWFLSKYLIMVRTQHGKVPYGALAPLRSIYVEFRQSEKTILNMLENGVDAVYSGTRMTIVSIATSQTMAVSLAFISSSTSLHCGLQIHCFGA